MAQLKEYIMSDEYPANEVDIFLLALGLGVNIIVLEKRITKKNPTGFYAFVPYKKMNFIILFNNSKLDNNNYNIVVKENNYLFKEKNLPDVIQKFIGIENSSNNNNQEPELKIGNKKIIKMKKK
jgi:hypothetical protein